MSYPPHLKVQLIKIAFLPKRRDEALRTLAIQEGVSVSHARRWKAEVQNEVIEAAERESSEATVQEPAPTDRDPVAIYQAEARLREIDYLLAKVADPDEDQEEIRQLVTERAALRTRIGGRESK